MVRGNTDNNRRTTYDEQGRTLVGAHDEQFQSLPTIGGDLSFAFNVPRSVARHVQDEPDDRHDRYSAQNPQVELQMGGTTGLRKQAKNLELSQNGDLYASMPSGIVKKLASSFAHASVGSKVKIDKEALTAITQASKWFLEQMGSDLGTYADHARRRNIDETDVKALMRRYVPYLTLLFQITLDRNEYSSL